MHNDGTVDLLGQAGATFGGTVTSSDGHTGTFNLDFDTTLTFSGSVSDRETVTFNGGANRLDLSDPADFAGTIRNFGAGNAINFTNVGATSTMKAALDAGTHMLTLTDGGRTVATLGNVYGAAGTLAVTADANGNASVGYAGSASQGHLAIAGGDRAMGSDVVRATMVVPNTATPITGAGIKIGIISDSFNRLGEADANAKAGFLPSGPDGTSAVTVLKEGPTGGEDEGQAMAELIHQVAPGAQLYFATDGTDAGNVDFADSVKALQGAGCTVIVDDIGIFAAAQFQVSGTLPSTVAGAVGEGVNYFTSAGNDGHAFYSGSFSGQRVTLADGSIVDANIFGNGTPYEAINVAANDSPRIELRWTSPYLGTASAGAPDDVTFKVFDGSGDLVGTSTQSDENGGTADTELILHGAATAQTYYVAVYNTVGEPVPGAFALTLADASHLTSIADPAAATGPGNVVGQELIPGVNTVGAMYYGKSAAFGQTPVSNDWFSSFGPGQLLYDEAGNAIDPQPAGKVDFTAPDGIDTTVLTSDKGFAPFYGTSAAAPDAAAVAALMLQADGHLTNKQVSYLLAKSAVPITGSPTAQSGAGLIQAPGAVEGAVAAATSAIWTAQDKGTAWSDAANWSDSKVPGGADAAQITDGIGELSGAYTSTDDVSTTVASLTVDGGTTTTPTLLVAGGRVLEVTGGLRVAHRGAIDLTGTLKLDGTAVDGTDGAGFAFNGGTLDAAVAGFSTALAATVGQRGGTVQVDGGTAAFGGSVTGSGTLAKTGAGTLILSGSNGFLGATRIEAGAIRLASAVAAGAGAIAFDATAGATATLVLGTAAQVLGGTFGNSLDDFGADDSLDLAGFTYDPGRTTVRYDGASGTLTVSNPAPLVRAAAFGRSAAAADGRSETFTLADASPDGTGRFYAHSDGHGGTLIDRIACYGTGTRIRTPAGDVAIDELRVGDLVVTASGEHRPVRWIGHRRVDCTRHRDPRAVWPVRVSADAVGPGLPTRDLWISPGHCVLAEGVLIPIRALVNGTTVAQVPVDTVTYHHLELDSHDVVLAEGLPAESYLDTGNRAAFEGGGAVALHPVFEPADGAGAGKCAPVTSCGREVWAARGRLAARVSGLGHTTTAEADLHIVADGRRVEPIALGGRRFAFYLPPDRARVALASRGFVPWHTDPASTDGRLLGVSVKALRLDGTLVDMETLAADGWHEAEVRPGHVQRWTDGSAALPAGTRVVAVDLAGEGRYRMDRGADPVARRA